MPNFTKGNMENGEFMYYADRKKGTSEWVFFNCSEDAAYVPLGAMVASDPLFNGWDFISTLDDDVICLHSVTELSAAQEAQLEVLYAAHVAPLV